MTIVLFLVDTSTSMAQRTYLGTSLLDSAKSVVEFFLKQRARDPNARGDRYMLLTFEDFPKNVKAGWREGQAVFHEQLKAIRPSGLTNFGPALGEALRFLNLNRMHSGIDNYGYGRFPYYLEPTVIVTITDGNCLTSAGDPIVPKEIQFAKPTAIGNELTDEPFRWDQRIFSIVLRLPGHPPKKSHVPGSPLPSDFGPIDIMCTATGGRSYCVSSHKMLHYCIESLVQKLQQQGVVVLFEQIGPEPPLLNINDCDDVNRNNGQLENGYIDSKDGNNESKKRENEQNEQWKRQLSMLYSRASRAYPGHWPIPESFWPDSLNTKLPARKAHPVLHFRCQPSEPLVYQEFPFDKYELESSPLTRSIIERKQPNVCWQVFVNGSGRSEDASYPFGYLKASTNLTTVNLFVMPYNYPVLLPLLEQIRAEQRGRPPDVWRLRFDKYLKSVPYYYFQPLRKALLKMNLSSLMPENERDKLYNYSVLLYLTKIKHVAHEEFERACLAVSTHLQTCPILGTTPQTVPLRHSNPAASLASKIAVKNADTHEFHGFNLFLANSSSRPGPSSLFWNPFDIPRNKLLEQVWKMRANLHQHLETTAVHTLEGGPPGTRLKLQQIEDLHSLPIGRMGMYQEYVKQQQLAGIAPLREVEPQAIRQHAFGNPFKLDKKNMLVDEVGEGVLPLARNSEKPKRPGSLIDQQQQQQQQQQLQQLQLQQQKSHAPPRRKAGPLSASFGKEWRRKRRKRRSVSDEDETLSIFSESNSLVIDYMEDTENESPTSTMDEPSTSNTAGQVETSPERPKVPAALPSKVARLIPEVLADKKDQLRTLITRPGLDDTDLIGRVSTIISRLKQPDRLDCLRYSIEQADRFKRLDLQKRLIKLRRRKKR